MLSDIRVLEISAPETMLGGQILGDLGADVVVVEPPEGALGRRFEPFLDGLPGLNRSLTWHALNRNKRGITLDLTGADGKAIFDKLAAEADIILEVAGVRDGEGESGRAVRCKITPFSEGGPKSSYFTSDLVFMAASGAPALAGDPDRAPLFFPYPQSIVEAGAEAAVGALAALLVRDRLGISQDATLSVRVAAAFGALGRLVAGAAGDKIDKRGEDKVLVPSIYGCADGYMLISIARVKTLIHLTKGIARWLADEGIFPAELADIDWLNFEELLSAGRIPVSTMADLVAAVERACLVKTKAQLVAIASQYGFMAAPVATMKDIHDFRQFIERGFFVDAPLPGDGRSVRVPLRFAQFSDFSIELRRQAPLLSEHSSEILRERAGLSQAEIQALFVHGVI
jgi:crotonobetainyl-CoA:carnitine CoA-transferase CaiB-like acyl-CoA transferase